MLPQLNMCSVSSLVARLCCVGFDIPVTSLGHNESYVRSILIKEQASCNLRRVFAVLVQRLRFFFCHVMRCWCLHGVALLEPEVFHEHVAMSGITLIHNSLLSPSATFCSML